MYNAAMIYLEGGKGIQVNKKAALAWLEKIQKTETIAVGDLIKKLEKEID